MKISIITVVKNNKNWISHTLQSILDQNYKNLELIVIDGMSSDGTDQIVKNYFKEFRLIRKKDKNVYESLNYACRIAKGKFISFLHSGDIYYDNNILNKVSKHFYKNDIISTNVVYFDNTLKVSRVWKTRDEKMDKDNYYKFAHTGFFYSSRVIKKNTYNDEYLISADSKYLLNLSIQDLNHKHLSLTSVCMYNKGLSTDIKYLLLRISEDLKYLFLFNKYLFFIFYLRKVLSKIKNYTFSNYQKNLYSSNVKKAIIRIEKKLKKKKIFTISYYTQFNEIKLVTKINHLVNSKKNFVLSALNLAFLGSFYSGKNIIYKNLYHWPDGYLPLFLTKNYQGINKIAGRNLLRQLKLSKNIKTIHVYGNLIPIQKKYLETRFKIKILHTKLPFGKNDELLKHFKKLKKNILYLFTLPTPKQEQIAQTIIEYNKNYKIILIGGALNIITGVEKEVPKNFEYLESFWRLRFDTYKRLNRFLITGTSFFYNYFISNQKNLKFRLYNNAKT